MTLHVYPIFSPFGPCWCADLRNAEGNILDWAYGHSLQAAADSVCPL